MEEDLKKIGLTDNEIKVYLSLLKIGETPVGGIISDIKFHRQLVYNALDSLEQKNMVTKTMKNKVNNYKITDPRAIVENIKTQEMIAERISKNIKEEMKKSRHEQEVNIHDGTERMRQFFLLKYKGMPKNSELLALYATGKLFEDAVGITHLKKFEKIRAKKNIITSHITSEDLREDLSSTAARLHAPSRKIRYLPYRITTPVTTLIWHDSVAFQLFGDFPFIIDIINKKMHDTFKEHFWALWKIAKL